MTGSVRTAPSTSWSFRQPVLTTREVGDLVVWLRQVADGAVPAVTTVGDPEAMTPGEDAFAGWLTFTEPNLSFAVSGYAGPQVTLLVGLSHESAAPPIDRQQPDRCQIVIVTDKQQVTDAAAALQEQLAAHPVR